MTNLEALSHKCSFLFPSFYPDESILEFTLLEDGLKPGDEYSVECKRKIAILAIRIISNNVETSHSEGGVSNAVDLGKVKENVIRECALLGIDASLYVSVSTIEDGSDSW
ncbi:MAG: hypothetical protein LIP01_11790 [Tannerellaceae bacterium]|nr:hypothetical protein [Tannerellaceae bacterium]